MYGNTLQQPPLAGEVIGAGSAKGASPKRPTYLFLALDSMAGRIGTLASVIDMLERDLHPILRPATIAKQPESHVQPPPQPDGEAVQQLRALSDRIEQLQDRLLQLRSNLDTVPENDGPY